ncbi:unnamed protein product [Mytilus coruscus]|uniref:Uncharacterized protein n=1 Tax=Mytilus coruscus TaxID=42192 RepID=A0A6J8F004_MYTCO|nr:unnamed protein product [Mytilus coruscus]
MNVFNEWQGERIRTGIIMPDLLQMDYISMDFWLQRLVMEARKKNGDEYPQKSIYYLFCGVMRYCRDNGLHVNFFNGDDATFAGLRKVLDDQMKQLLGKGLGTNIKKADAISGEDEEILWSSRVFGTSTATTLQYTIFIYACKVFGLRGKDEHRKIECSQFELGEDQKGKFIRLVSAGLDKQSIMDHTVYRSTAVRAYKTKTNEIAEKVSMALNPPSEENTVGTRDEKQPPTKKIKFDNYVEVHDDTKAGIVRYHECPRFSWKCQL